MPPFRRLNLKRPPVRRSPKKSVKMSANPDLHEGRSPLGVAQDEVFLLILEDACLTVESGK